MAPLRAAVAVTAVAAVLCVALLIPRSRPTSHLTLRTEGRGTGDFVGSLSARHLTRPQVVASASRSSSMRLEAAPGGDGPTGNDGDGPQANRSLPVRALRLLVSPITLLVGLAAALFRWVSGGKNQTQDKPQWSFRAFLAQFLFFNGDKFKVRVPLLAKAHDQNPIQGLDGRPIVSPGNVVLVTGATGGLGRRVVDRLAASGQRVRVLVRDVDKARRLLGPAGQTAAAHHAPLEVVVADITQPRTLQPAMFQGVRAVVSCTAVTVAPKEGDTPDRTKYSQGIRFFDPEIVGDTPEAVEYRGLRNLVAAVRPSLTAGAELFAIQPGTTEIIGQPWGSLDDVVMGGVSASGFSIVPGAGEDGAAAAGVFAGTVRTENNGGFVSIRTRDYDPPLDLSASDGLEFRLKGDGRRYKVQVRTEAGWDVGGYSSGFDTEDGVWQTIRVPWAGFVANRRTRVVEDAPPINTRNVISLQILHSKFELGGELNPRFKAGDLTLPITRVAAYSSRTAPRFIHVGSAGVTRWNRLGVDLDKEPPAVRLNEQLGGIMTYKLKGEDVVRGSGIPYAIVRPCALTEEPAGMPLVVDQGDVVRGKVGRDDVADLVVAMLDLPLRNVTFEVKSTVPFSEPWTGPPSPVARDWAALLAPLREGVTGKTEEATLSSVS